MAILTSYTDIQDHTALSAFVPKVTSIDVTINVPADFPTLQAAFDEATTYLTQGGAVIKIVLAAGTYNIDTFVMSNPLNTAVQIVGTGVNTRMTRANFTGVKATDEATIRATYSAVLESTVTRTYINVRNVTFINLGVIFTGTGTAVYGFDLRRCAINFNYCAFSGYFVAIRLMEQTISTSDRLAIVHSTGYSIQARDGTYLSLTNTLVAYNDPGDGLYVFNNAYLNSGSLDLFGNRKAVIVTQNAYAGVYTATIEQHSSWCCDVARQAGLTLNTVSFVQGGGAVNGILVNAQAYSSYGNCSFDAAFKITALRSSITQRLGTITGSPVYSPALNTFGAFGEYNF